MTREELRSLYAEARPRRDWRWERGSGGVVIPGVCVMDSGDPKQDEANARLICEVRNAIPGLAAKVREADTWT
jgi:hypothetical protein